MAFHDAIDAVSWALEVQQQLLLLPWPPQLLTQPDAAELYDADPTLKELVIFKGLRVRMALHTGQPEAIQVALCITTRHCAAKPLTTAVCICCAFTRV